MFSSRDLRQHGETTKFIALPQKARKERLAAGPIDGAIRHRDRHMKQ